MSHDYKSVVSYAELTLSAVKDKLREILPEVQKNSQGWPYHNDAYRACSLLRLAMLELETSLMWIQGAAIEDGTDEDKEAASGIPRDVRNLQAKIDDHKTTMKKRIAKEAALGNPQEQFIFSVSGDTDESESS